MNKNPFPLEEHAYSSPSNEKLKKKPFWRRHFLKIYATVTTVLMLLLGYSTVTFAMEDFRWQRSTSTRSNPTPITQLQPTPKPTATLISFPALTPTPSLPAIPSGVVLCHTDWSQGMDGWSGSPDWKQVSGMLVNDGTETGDGRSIILAPCKFSLSNYAVEADIQYVRYGQGFGILARGDGGGATGYMGMVNISTWSGSAAIVSGDTLASKNYEINSSWHTYRLEVRDEKLVFFIDQQKIVETTDTTYLSAGRVGLVVNGGSQINVKSFQVVAL